MAENEIVWPEGWTAQQENLAGTSFSIHIGLDHYNVSQSGGNESLWYVTQYWIGEPEEVSKDITGQCATLQEAIDNLRQYLAGEFVPSGDVITVLLEGMVTDEDLPVHHNYKGDLRVYVSIRSDRP